MPANYPPVRAGDALAGMGTPDLRGTQGTFTFYTDDPGLRAEDVPGGRIVTVNLKDGHAALTLEGPPNSLRRDGAYAVAQIDVDIDPAQPYARVAIGDTQAIVREGEWSDWLAADFPLIPHVASAHGMVRVYARQLHPRFELYVSAVNVDPSAPDLPISTPANFSRDIARRIGRFSTLGIAEDTSALRQGVFNLQEFEQQAALVEAEEKRLFDDALSRFHQGFLFVYFSSVDQNSHILWGAYESDLLRVYQAMDDRVGEARRRTPQAELMVMSDHGFAPFTRAVNLNNWLEQQGWLARRSSEAIDWAHTKAYAMGLNALYINTAGRERSGIVSTQERGPLIEQIRAALLEMRDGGAVVVKSATPTRNGPDLIVGYARNYRASWQTGTGGFGGAAIEDNIDAWVGDHCIDAGEVPGVLFSTRRLAAGSPSLVDLAVTILGHFGLAAK